MSLCTMSGLFVAGMFSLQTPTQEEPQAKLVWGDFDRDGLLDLYSIDPLGEDLLLRNAGEGRFDDVTADFALPTLRSVRAAAFGDYDEDGWPDLFLITENGKGRLLRNLRGELFQDVTEAAGLASQGYAESLRWHDFDRDGNLDLVLVGPMGDSIFHNAGDVFRKVELPRRLLPGLSPGTMPTILSPQSDASELGLPGFARLPNGVGPRGAGRGAGGGDQALRSGPMTGAAGSPMQSATAGTGSGVGGPGGGGPTFGGPPTPTGGGSQPITLEREIPSGFSILGEVGAPAPTGYISTGITVESNGNAWFKPNLPMAPGPDDLEDNRLLAGYAVAIDTSGHEKLFVFGGTHTAGGTPVATGWKFDAEAPRGSMPSEQWAPIAPMAQPARSAMAVVTVDNLIYAFGGRTSGGGTTAQVEIYDPLLNTWTSLSVLQLPLPLSGSGIGAIGRRIYLFGGANVMGMAQSVLRVLDLDTPGAGWTVVTGSGITPTARQFPASGVFGGKLYVIGGSNTSGFLDVVEVYDPELNRWELRTPRPTTFQSAVISVAHGKITVFGGENPLPMGDVHEYDPVDDNWTTRESMITPRAKCVAGRLCKSTYVGGGEDEGMGPMPVPMPVPANEEYLEAQDDQEVFTKI